MVHSLYTCQDSYVTVVTLSIASYSILYFEQILWLLPFVPLAMILFIFNNLHTRAKFERPQKNVCEEREACAIYYDLCAALLGLEL